HTDDTIVPLAQKGGTKQARAWVYVDPHTRLAAYDFSETRAGEHPQAWLKGWHGYLVADAYSGYDALYANPAIREVACWAHV
ncbi:IS66 family transposase, partial [Chitinimonas sp. PSY-7]